MTVLLFEKLFSNILNMPGARLCDPSRALYVIVLKHWVGTGDVISQCNLLVEHVWGPLGHLPCRGSRKPSRFYMGTPDLYWMGLPKGPDADMGIIKSKIFTKLSNSEKNCPNLRVTFKRYSNILILLWSWSKRPF